MSNIRIATTTSVVDSGLSVELTREFNSATGNTITWLPLGSGGAMNAARQGLADLVIAHDRVGEHAFIAENYSLRRQVCFYNYFVLVGPSSTSPAGSGPITGTTLKACFQQIYDNLNTGPANITYVSRGPSGLSGTFVREQQIWRLLLNLTPSDPPYPALPFPTGAGPGIVAGGGGAGMLATLNDTLNRVLGSTPYSSPAVAYTLTDIGTWYAFKDNVIDASNLTMLTSDDGSDPWSSNQYVMMLVNPNACFLTAPNPPINLLGAREFFNWMFTACGDHNARNTVNDFEKGEMQGFFWNCEALPGERCLLRFLPKIYVNQIYNDPGTVIS